LLDANTYSIENYYEAYNVGTAWSNLVRTAEKINDELAAEYKDAFFQLVLHPVKAYANLQDLYTSVAWNNLLAKEKLPVANDYADKARELYKKDSLLSVEYNKRGNGKWNHMMDQTHIGYTYWQQPPTQKMPAVFYVNDTLSTIANRTGDQRLYIKSTKVPFITRPTVFYEADSFVSIGAAHFSKKVDANNVKWKMIPDIGKDGDGITTFPVTASSGLSSSSPHVEYNFYCDSKDSLKLLTYFSPTLNFHHSASGLQYAVSIDNETPQIMGLNKEDNTGIWNAWVANNIIIKTTKHFVARAGKHTVKYWMIDPGIVLQKLVVDFGGLKPSYLGPPETLYKK